MNKTVVENLNKQLNRELYSSYLYLSMSAYCASQNLSGCAHWFRLQSQEEETHGMKIYDFILQRDGEVVLEGIQKPLGQFESIVDVFEKAYAHEKHVTQCLNDLAGVAMQEKDHATAIFLQWFITEQIEEEANVKGLLENLKLAGGSGQGLLMIDRELGGRKGSTGEGAGDPT